MFHYVNSRIILLESRSLEKENHHVI